MGKYSRKAGARRYRDFTDATLQKALDAIRSGQMTLRKASETYNISAATLSRKRRGQHMKKHGGQVVLSPHVENLIAQNIILASDWGFPIDAVALKNVIKNYLENAGVTVPKFHDGNSPGKEWVAGFLRRHSSILSRRWCQNIKRARSAVDSGVIREFFSEIEVSLSGVEPAALVNYDETAMIDDPKKAAVFCRRGSKRAYRIIDTSKNSYSVMFSGSASGHLLPPYVVFRAERLMDGWTMGGPKGTRYNVNPRSSWFNTALFEDWFFTVALPYFRRLNQPDSPKVLVGDNLASHMSVRVMTACKENNIRFVLLPPNSTHLLQPLDVAFFKPLKSYWNKVILNYKQHHKGTLPKTVFPQLLKETLDMMDENGSILRSLQSGFEASGLCPININKVIQQVPQTNPDDEGNDGALQDIVNNSFAIFLRDLHRKETATTTTRRNKRLNVIPGRSVTNLYEEAPHDVDTTIPVPAVQKKNPPARRKLNLPPTQVSSDSEKSVLDSDSDLDYTPDDPPPLPSRKRSTRTRETEEESSACAQPAFNAAELPSTSSRQTMSIADLRINEFIVVYFPYQGRGGLITHKMFIGIILLFLNGKIRCSFLRKSPRGQNLYCYPNVPDVTDIDIGQVAKKVKPLFEKRGSFCFPEE